MTVGRKWREVPEEFASEIRGYLVEKGGIDAGQAVGPAEAWRVRFGDASITYYKKGTLYSTGSPSLDVAVRSAWAFVDEGSPPAFILSSKAFLIGLDESGKGELVGHMVLAGALIPAAISSDVERIVALAETKTGHGKAYWDALIVRLAGLKHRGLDYIVEKIPPRDIDRYNLNRLLDVTYERILNSFSDRVQPELSRIVVDDYRVGYTLRAFLRGLENEGAEVVIESRADDRYWKPESPRCWPGASGRRCCSKSTEGRTTWMGSRLGLASPVTLRPSNGFGRGKRVGSRGPGSSDSRFGPYACLTGSSHRGNWIQTYSIDDHRVYQWSRFQNAP
jgi:ribonuclease HIII